VATNVLADMIRTAIDQATVTAASVTLSSTLTADIDVATIGFAGGGAGGAGGGIAISGAGAGCITILTSDITTEIQGGRVTATTGDVSLTAKDDSSLVAAAGAVAGSGAGGAGGGISGQVGASFVTNTITNEITATIGGGAVVTAEGDVGVYGEELADILAVTIGFAGGGSGGAGGGVQIGGAGSGSVNVAVNTIKATIESSTVTTGGTLTVSALDDVTIDAGSGGASFGGSGGAGGGVSGSIGASVVVSVLTTTAEAYIDASTVSADSVSALSTSTADVMVVTVAGAGAGSGGAGGGVSVSGAGAVAVNTITKTLEAEIRNGSTVTTTAGGVTLRTTDDSTTTLGAGAGTLAGSGGAGGGVSVSVGAAVATNPVTGTVRAQIEDSTVTAAGAVTAEATWDADVQVEAFGIGAAISGGALNGVSVSGVGAVTVNTIDGTIDAQILDSTVNATGAVALRAIDNSTITLDAGGFSAAGAGGIIGVSTSVAASVAVSQITNQIHAVIDNSTIRAGGDVTLDAQATATIEALCFSGSLNVALGGGSVGVSVGATTATNIIDNTIDAAIRASQVTTTTGNLSVTAIDNSTIDADAGAGSVSISGSFVGAVDVSIGAAAAVNDITSNTTATIDQSTVTADAVTVKADSTASMDALAVATSVSTSIAPTGISFAGGGAGAGNTADGTIAATISGNSTITATGDVSLSARDSSTLKADVGSGALSIALIGASVGLSVSTNLVDRTVTASIEDSVVTTGGDLSLSAQSVTDVDAIAIATSMAFSAGLAGAGTGIDIKTQVRAFAEDATLTAAGEINVNAKADNTVKATAGGGTLGSVAVGASAAVINLGRGNDVNEVVASLGARTHVQGKILNVSAISTDDVLALSVATGGGGITVLGAQSTVNSDVVALAEIGENAEVNATTLTVNSYHTQEIDSMADAASLALAAGTGAGTDNNVNTAANVLVGANASVTAQNILIAANNVFVKDKYADSYNLVSGSANVAGVTVLLSDTDIGTESRPFEANVTILPGAHLTAQGTSENAGIFRIETATDVTAIDAVRVDTVSGFAIATGLSRITSHADAKIEATGATLENQTGDLYLTTGSDSALRASSELFVVSAISSGVGA